MSHIHIRAALAKDIQAIEGIVENAYKPYCKRIGRKPAPMTEDYARLIKTGTIWVISAEDVIVGYIVLRDEFDHVFVDNIAVTPACHGYGLGRTLLNYAETHARERGVNELRLYTNEKMHENLAIYAKLGWHEYDRAEQDGFHRVFMRKCLSKQAE